MKQEGDIKTVKKVMEGASKVILAANDCSPALGAHGGKKRFNEVATKAGFTKYWQARWHPRSPFCIVYKSKP